jgi:hypothetical protein
MSSKAVLTFIDTVIQHYPPYRWDEEQEKAWVSTMARELSGFSEDVLDRAIKEMIRTRKDRRIPLVPECLSACHDAKRWIDAEKRNGQLPIEQEGVPSSWAEHTNERKKLALDILRSPVGRQAAQEGWIGALDEYVRKNAKMPPPSEFGALKRKAKEFDEAYALCVRGVAEIETWVPKDKRAEMIRCREEMLKVCEGIGAKLLREREALVDRVLHGVVG